MEDCKTLCQNSGAYHWDFNAYSNLWLRSCNAIVWSADGSCYLKPNGNQHLYDSGGRTACVLMHEWFRDLNRPEDPGISLTHESYPDSCSNSNMLYREAGLRSCYYALWDHGGANVYIYDSGEAQLSLIHI